MARPNKFLDAAKLEEWVIENHPDVWEEWEFSLNVSEYFDFWEWLDRAYCDILFEFEEWFRTKDDD